MISVSVHNVSTVKFGRCQEGYWVTLTDRDWNIVTIHYDSPQFLLDLAQDLKVQGLIDQASSRVHLERDALPRVS